MLLAVDTSTAQMGLALFDGTRILAEAMWSTQQHHTTELAPAVADLLRRCGVPVDRLQALGVALGPGSFTALRVGLAFAKGLALARHLPLVGIPSLDVVAAGHAGSKHRLAAVLQAGRGRLAIGWYKFKRDHWDAVGPAQIGTADTLANSIHEPTLVAGELTAEDRQRLARKHVNVILVSPANSIRRPALLAELAWARWKGSEVDDPAGLAPIYLHLSEAAAA
jgi:tRNA threonylcarbamoyladenosine biosynthesis protein TsaB